jgi:putative tryptophan/tyrosine transport system substrate-binding protein
MSKKIMCLALSAMLFALCSSAAAQQPKKASRIGYLLPGNRTNESIVSEAIRRALHELGYLEGQNVAFEYRYAEGNPDRFPELAAELVRLKVDIIVVVGGTRRSGRSRMRPRRFPLLWWAAPIPSRQA